MTQNELNYNRIAEAIQYLQQHFQTQPSLEEVAQHVHLSPFHFQRMFTEWAGVSPKKFLQFISLEHAKEVLAAGQKNLAETAFAAGLSGTSRLHDLFVQLEGMTPGEYKNGCAALHIRYSFAESPFGKILVASTSKGICYLNFVEDKKEALIHFMAQFPNAKFEQECDLLQQNALLIFSKDWSQLDKVKVHLKGTAFQLKVWESLLRIPAGGLSTYGQIARRIEQPKAARAVGSAVGANPIAYLIPCHRVIRASGVFGQYRWGSLRKTAILGWEQAQAAEDFKPWRS